MSRSPFLKAKLQKAGALHKIVWRPDGLPIPRKSTRLVCPKAGEKITLPRLSSVRRGEEISFLQEAKTVKVERALVVQHTFMTEVEVDIDFYTHTYEHICISPRGEFFEPTGRVEVVYHGHKGRFQVCLAA
jgi:NADPH-dependent ferric siderophore reductase